MTGLQVAASVGISLGEVQDMVNGAVDDLSSSLASEIAGARPIYMTRAASKTSDGSNPTTLTFHGPPTGSLWQIRFITTFGIDAYTPVVNGSTPPTPMVGALYAGDPTRTPSLAQLLLVGFQFPSTTYVPDTTMWCHPGQSLFIVTGSYIPPAQQIGAVAGIEEWKESAISRHSGR